MPEQGKPIVVGVDLSECSRGAVEAATKMAARNRAKLIMVYAFEKLPRVVVAPSMVDDPMTKLQGEFDMDDAVELTTKWAESVRAKGIDVEVVATHDKPSELLLEIADKFDAECIVVGTHGHKAFKRFILGSVADRVIRASTRPVHVVPMAATES